MDKGKEWTDQIRENLVKDYQNDLSYKELAKKYDRSVKSIRSQLYVLRKKGLIGKRR
jgi:transposase